jgi:adenosyl cobinamide kinase/adenosyl cobinamide phosphate guanylyltransferase
MSDQKVDKDGDPIFDREANKEVFNPNTYILSNEHLTIIGGTQSGKTNHAIYYARSKKAQGNRVVFITAKPERKYRESFDLIANDSENALEMMLRKDPKTKKHNSVLWEADIEDGEEVAYFIDTIGEYLREGERKSDRRPLTVIVDEYSLLVRNKMDGSNINISLQRAAATWRAYSGQLITVAQRSSMIHHTVLTQSRLTMYRVPSGDLKSLNKIIYPDLDESITRFVDENQFSFVVADGFDLNRFAPIPLQS